MALVKCKECNSLVSTKASACPTCGAKRTKKFSRFTWALIAFLGFLLVQMNFPSPPTSSSSSIVSPPTVTQDIIEKPSIASEIKKPETYENTNITEACDFLKREGFSTKKYKETYSNNFQCITDYISVGSSDGINLTNNIAYYASGKKSVVNQLKLVMNVNQKDKSSEVIKKLLTVSETLAMKAIGISLPPVIFNAIKKPASVTYKHGQVSLQVVHVTWGAGKGFEVKFIIR